MNSQMLLTRRWLLGLICSRITFFVGLACAICFLLLTKTISLIDHNVDETYGDFKKLIKKTSKNYSLDYSQLFVITPTYKRLEQRAALINTCFRIAYNRELQRNITWIVVEDSKTTTKLVEEVLAECPLKSVHINIKSPLPSELEIPAIEWTRSVVKGAVARGLWQRNIALDWIRSILPLAPKVHQKYLVYFADDDNIYHPDLFREIFKTKQLSTWPVGLLAHREWEGCHVASKPGPITDMFTGWWLAGRNFPLDMASFAFNARLLLTHSNAAFKYESPVGLQEDRFLTALGFKDWHNFEPLANYCSRECVVQATKADKVDLRFCKGLIAESLQKRQQLFVEIASIPAKHHKTIADYAMLLNVVKIEEPKVLNRVNLTKLASRYKCISKSALEKMCAKQECDFESIRKVLFAESFRGNAAKEYTYSVEKWTSSPFLVGLVFQFAVHFKNGGNDIKTSELSYYVGATFTKDMLFFLNTCALISGYEGDVFNCDGLLNLLAGVYEFVVKFNNLIEIIRNIDKPEEKPKEKKPCKRGPVVDVNKAKLKKEITNMSEDTQFIDSLIRIYGGGKNYLNKEDFMLMCRAPLNIYVDRRPRVNSALTPVEYQRFIEQLRIAYGMDVTKCQSTPLTYRMLKEIAITAGLSKDPPKHLFEGFKAEYSGDWNITMLESYFEDWVCRI
ncbi:hypothetical protein Ciccas_003493 [Cichlidogyrus casuarinus]|uniref:Galactosylgalactosylxylosylprotein 3-beta-glucuronosyltransferase n=1 Tax=Cichlidogyrus casuarinus TaxID=1844966 RepID=A0ABD2QEN4_9PLAT